MITKTIEYWALTQLVKERIAREPVEAFILKYFGYDWKYNIFKTDKDEILQIYNSDTCLTVIGGSSSDKYEWRSNIKIFSLKRILKERKFLVDGFHYGYWTSATDVYNNPKMIKRREMIYDCHSRGAGIAIPIIYRFGGRGVGFGVPKVTIKNIPIDFVNIHNRYDPVTHVAPLMKTTGEVRELNFIKSPHTKYGDNINPEELI